MSIGQVSQREKSERGEKVGECYQWKAIGPCSKEDLCSFNTRVHHVQKHRGENFSGLKMQKSV